MGGTADQISCSIRSVLRLLPSPLRIRLLRRRLRAAQRNIEAIEFLDIAEDLKRAAIRRVQRRFEEALDRFTRAS